MPKDASPPLLLHHHHFSSSSLRRSALACSTKKTEEARKRSQICAETEEAKRTEETERDLSRAPLPSDDLLSVSSGSLKPIGWGLGRDDRRDGRRSALHRCRQFLAHRRLIVVLANLLPANDVVDELVLISFFKVQSPRLSGRRKMSSYRSCYLYHWESGLALWK